MSRNSLTKPSNCSRTQHEHRSRSFDPSGARAEDGQGVGCWERWRVGTSCCAGKKRVACAFSNPAEQKKSHWTVPAPALLSPLMQPSVKAPQQSSPSPGTDGSNPSPSSGESANYRFRDFTCLMSGYLAGFGGADQASADRPGGSEIRT